MKNLADGLEPGTIYVLDDDKLALLVFLFFCK